MADGYRVRSDEIWARARTDYIAGFPAEEVCRRHDLGVSALRHRARREGWRRTDHPASNYIEDDLEIFADIGSGDMAEMARLRLAAALTRGQSGEAARWRRIYRELRGEWEAEVRREENRVRLLHADEAREAAALARPTRAAAPEAPGLHQLHSKNSGPALDPSTSRQVRRQLERQSAKGP